jgi:hypothetical protein
MSHPTIIYWPSYRASFQEIARAQTVADNGNGNFKVQITSNQPNMPNVPVNNSGVYYMPSMLRTLSFGSEGGDLSALQITIKGLSCAYDAGATGNPIEVLTDSEETIQGPTIGSGGRVFTGRLYARVDSITLSAGTGVNEITVGLGRAGITAYIYLNLNNAPPQHWTLQGAPSDPGNVQFFYGFYMSLTRPETIDYNKGNLIPYMFNYIPAFLIGAEQSGGNYLVSNFDNQVLSTNDPQNFNRCSPIANIVWAAILDNTTDPETANTAFYFTCVQQGIAI